MNTIEANGRDVCNLTPLHSGARERSLLGRQNANNDDRCEAMPSILVLPLPCTSAGTHRGGRGSVEARDADMNFQNGYLSIIDTICIRFQRADNERHVRTQFGHTENRFLRVSPYWRDRGPTGRTSTTLAADIVNTFSDPAL